jgi:hypothetical protein
MTTPHEWPAVGPKLLEWLEQCGKIKARLIRVKIGKREWLGARYTQVGQYTQDMMACQDGRKKPGDTYEQELVYCIGTRLKQNAVCFPCSDDGHEWYVAAYLDSIADKAQFAEFHPFGPNFILAPWDIPGTKVDTGERKPYTRIPVEFSNL